MANLKEKLSRTKSEFSVIDEKLSSSIVKLAGRNEIPETFWKSVGPAGWMYTEIPKGQRYKLLMRLKIIKKSQSIPVWHVKYISSWDNDNDMVLTIVIPCTLI